MIAALFDPDALTRVAQGVTASCVCTNQVADNIIIDGNSAANTYTSFTVP